ncbi:MAG: GGDEF domain-containing protein [Chloroflexi bacterium]|nr:GGDEF domain-containing protein [Chloroflexota bacterium]
MTKPSDYSAAEAIEVKGAGDSRGLNRLIWCLRLVGGVLLLVGWWVVSLHDYGSIRFIFDTLVFAGLAAYAFLAAAFGRRVAVNLEKRLRLQLLVHNMELENMAMRDDLTQLFNRRYLFDRLERELQSARGFQRPLTVLTIDIDSLKAVNDTYGHLMGDKALASFGRFLLNHTRATDVPARSGGDEFAIILPDTSKRGGCTMMERLTRALDKTNIIDEDGLTLRLTASIGMSGYPWAGESVDAIMQEADASMYAQKQARKKACAGPSEDGGNGAQLAPVPTVFRRTDEVMGDNEPDPQVP